jgi:hypothetical protein
VLIENRPAVQVIAQMDTAQTLFYCDPPYVFGTRKGLRLENPDHRYKHEMTDAEHRELGQVLNTVAGMVVLRRSPGPTRPSTRGSGARRSRRAAITATPRQLDRAASLEGRDALGRRRAAHAHQRRELAQAARWHRLAQKGLMPDGKTPTGGQRPRVFCASLADVLDNEVPDEWRATCST